jgi:ribosomal protein S18 acetylase RimI-like enzyme
MPSAPSGNRAAGEHRTPRLLRPASAAQWLEARRLVEEYAASLNIDLCFQNFAQELEHFDQEYSAPFGAFLLARNKGACVGCVGLRKFHDKVGDSVGEIKRLYVQPGARGLGLGMSLIQGIMGEAKAMKYTRLVLDTLPSMLEAQSLYKALGFKPIEAYRYNPVPGAIFFELQFRA